MSCGDDANAPGFFGARAAATVQFQRTSESSLFVETIAEGSDLTLAIRAPDGTWLCDDDSAGNLNARVVVPEPATGTFEIWVGSYGPSQPATAPIQLAAGPPPTAIRRLDRADRIPSSFDAGPLTLLAGGVERLPCGDGWADGYFFSDATPTLTLEVATPEIELLSIRAIAPDVTLALRGQDGRCYDIDAGSLATQVLRTGRYEIWVGSYYAGQPSSAEIIIEAFRVDRSVAVTPIRAGFAEPSRFQIRAGGVQEFPNLPLRGDCGDFYIDSQDVSALEIRPSSIVRYDRVGRRNPLTIRLRDAETPSQQRRALAVRAPGGAWRCSADSAEALATITFADARSGDYVVFAGTRQREEGHAVLEILDFLRPNPCLQPMFTIARAPSANRSADEMSLGAASGECQRGSTQDEARLLRGSIPIGDVPSVVPLSAGGSIDASQAIPNDVHRACRGFIGERPSLKLNATAGAAFALSVRAEADTTLVVQAPDGRWHCDDDGGPAYHPALQFNSAQTGVYAIFVGNYDAVGRSGGDDTQRPAELHITR
ncbi:MAG: hypothetical protein AB7O98_12185 [Hyphomonadaceae bacterium]